MKNRTGFWTAHVAAVRREAISARAYARQHNLSVAALYYWQRKLKLNAENNEAGQAGKFLALSVAARPPCHCTLVLPSGLHLEMTALPAPEWLAALGCAMPGAH